MLLCLQPGGGLFVAALGTMTVLAGVVTVVVLLALLTAIELTAENSSAAFVRCPAWPADEKAAGGGQTWRNKLGHAAEDLGYFDHKQLTNRS